MANVRTIPFILIGKTLSKISQMLNRGNGTTWPGHIALSGNPWFIKDILSRSKTKIIIVAGTNGKTTTAGLIATCLEKNGSSVIQNTSGANLLNGIASTILLHTNAEGILTQDYAIFEIDENALPLILQQVTPEYLILLNLFRDQLDRYGEINTISLKWQVAISALPKETKLILNADDPQIAVIGIKSGNPASYFSVAKKQTKKNSNQLQTADALSCPHCHKKLSFEYITFSHLGKWQCTACGLRQPKSAIDSFIFYPLSGTYNKYNTHAAVLVLTTLGIQKQGIQDALHDFKPAFGRQETVSYNGKAMQLFLSKNPTSFNESYATIQELKGKTLLIILNDRIPDGRDVSWIWDIDLFAIDNFKHIILAGDRVYDMALRIKYTDYKNYLPYDTVKDALSAALSVLSQDETLYILPTYSAMLDVRKLVTGKKIL